MNYNNLLIQKSNNRAVITINRPEKLNALNKPTIEELHNALTVLKEDKEARVIIITGAGQKAFVAGADISEFASFGVEEGKQLAAQGQKLLFDYIENYPKPVIAAINGYALGGGLELAMACHVRIASNNARLGLPEVTLGLIPGYGGTQRLAQLVGKGKALEMILTAGMIQAEEALQWGLVNKLTSQEELMDEATALADAMSKNSSTALAAAIRAVNAGYTYQRSGLDTEIEEFGRCFGTADFKEGTTAFLEKRKPKFS
ncbi:enoyl-CoA hydratase [Thermaurantimonas aggregans]|uniref:Enoyl-CoA hydratase n=1 Tax=Thermaurantimonas aggregans TaxID=2173829 RepID=A0A401XIK6_9FLAO|nr:enoyl-CoA hydratase-related protein [Thermaurantimonas aggregans]MCX8148792.1 enoyl-CoA hydratase-related protein [Thermaurantimonas aggregans]GCD76849.1 enoyl-CoA hydratase [Thermaurantimonas aggregans]